MGIEVTGAVQVKPVPPMKRIAALVAKLAFVALVFWYLGRKNLVSTSVLTDASAHTGLAVIGAFAAIVSFFVGGYRLFLLLRAQGYALTFVGVFRLHVIGQFFNIALPGAVSGDLVKSYYLRDHSDRGGAHALGVLVFDRVIGLSAMILTSAIALYSPLIRIESNGFFLLRNALTLLAAGVIGFFAYLFLVTEERDPLLGALLAGERRVTIIGKFRKLYEGMKSFHHHRGAVTAALALSLLIQTLIGFACYEWARALGEAQLHQTAVYAVSPIGLLVTAVPILPGGVGTGHAAFSYLFNWMGSARGADIFSLHALVQIVIGLVCGIYYLRYKRGAPTVSRVGTDVIDGVETRTAATP